MTTTENENDSGADAAAVVSAGSIAPAAASHVDREATCDWNCARSFPHDGPCSPAQQAEGPPRCRCGHERDDHQSKMWLERGEKFYGQVCEHCPCKSYLEKGGALDSMIESFRKVETAGPLGSRAYKSAVDSAGDAQRRGDAGRVEDTTALEALAAEFIRYWTTDRTPDGCGMCGGVPHSTTCYVGRMAALLGSGNKATNAELAETTRRSAAP